MEHVRILPYATVRRAGFPGLGYALLLSYSVLTLLPEVYLFKIALSNDGWGHLGVAFMAAPIFFLAQMLLVVAPIAFYVSRGKCSDVLTWILMSTALLGPILTSVVEFLCFPIPSYGC